MDEALKFTVDHYFESEVLEKLLSDQHHRKISMEESLRIDRSFRHAAHCFICAPLNKLVLGKYPSHASVLMQLRFDGLLGFPGGIIEREEDIVCGLNRELQEEINLDLGRFMVREADHLISHVNHRHKFVFHFYSLPVTFEEFRAIEKQNLEATDYGNETLGILRVPLYTMKDGYHGLAAFLNQQFVGNAKDQLLYGLAKLKILTPEELSEAIHKSQALKLTKAY
ncbi:U8 snoRNA-decapping enzyme-like isoform X2 [Limulus polyphemus]|uniref:U8 snoRNA-decapping enzyme n=1 Tax=Limulus polyphemus TaxID=6850 RepID=A0ABM1BIR7_LIMPO|nr:U8 snoRNA-decapping enzyme-like isoform X2 [Limulus polyphemus]